MRTYLLQTRIQHGEKEFSQIGFVTAQDDETEQQIIHHHLMNFYEDFYDTDGRWYSYEAGAIMARNEGIKEISEEDLLILKQYLQ